MRKVFVSLFLGFGAAFVAWTSLYAVIDLAELETTELKEHGAVVIGAALLLLVGWIVLSQVIEPALSLVAAVTGCALLWNTRALPEGPGYSGEYWGVVVVATVAFMVHMLLLNRDYFRSPSLRR